MGMEDGEDEGWLGFGVGTLEWRFRLLRHVTALRNCTIPK